MGGGQRVKQVMSHLLEIWELKIVFSSLFSAPTTNLLRVLSCLCILQFVFLNF